VTEFSSGIPEGARLVGITAASDGKVWFADQGTDTAGSINPFNQITSEIPSADLFQIAGLTNGSDGNLYYGRTDDYNSVGGIIPATGVIRNTYLGGALSARFSPYVPATGPDGNIWITDPGDAVSTANDNVGLATPRVDPNLARESGGPIFQGVFNLTANSDPQAIAAGPTDTSSNPSEGLWVAEFSTNKIARLTPVFTAGGEGALLTEYTGLSSGAHPTGIALGPDGNIWFSEFDAGKVGRLIPPSTFGGSPTIDEFAIPTAGSHPWGIAAGPDGNLWIAESGAGKVARMTTSGVVTGEFPTQNGSPFFITAGADGNMWFSEGSENSVGRITTGLDQPAFRSTSAIPIPLVGAPTPDTPAQINVSGLQGTITDVNVRLTGISHTFPDDMDVILQSPTGQTALVMSDVGSAVGSRATNKTSYPADGITLTLDDQAARQLSDTNPLVSGIYRPTNIIDPNEGTTEGDAPGPFSTNFPSALSTFNGQSANGTWRLWVDDDNLNAKDTAGKVYGGWGLDISTTGPPAQQGTPPVTTNAVPAAVKKKCKKKKKRR
jgi:streptogramin lyase/subtilisin-like proprotein convertase family protein